MIYYHEEKEPPRTIQFGYADVLSSTHVETNIQDLKNCDPIL